MSSKSYRSTGTVQVRFELGGTKKIFFTPNTDSTVRYGGKQYAVFIRVGRGKARLSNKPLGKSGKGVPLKVKTEFPGLVEAAAQQISVEVEVVKCNSGWALRAITIPATGKKK